MVCFNFLSFFSQHGAREEILANGGSLSHHHGGMATLTFKNTDLKCVIFVDIIVKYVQNDLQCFWVWGNSCCKCAFGLRAFIAPPTCSRCVPTAQMNCSDSVICSFQQWPNETWAGQRSASPGPIRANRNGCLIYIAIRLAVFIHHSRLFITPVKNSMQWICCDIKSQFFLKAGTASKLKDC